MFYYQNIYAYKIRLISLPCSVKAYTIYDAVEDFYNIYINSKLSQFEAEKALRHELKHIENGDFHSDSNVGDIENQYQNAV